MIVIIDYNVGNLQSVSSAFKRAGMDTIISRNHEVIKQASAIVLPGVGSFVVAMDNLKKFNLIGILQECKEANIPILGICLGMQILFEKGYEGKVTAGLGFLKGEVKYMDIEEKVPHMGWNQLHMLEVHPIRKYLEEGDEVYFVHSYKAQCESSQIIAYSRYGDTKIPAIVYKENVIGCQFHPEKSGSIGAYIIQAFKEMVIC